MSDKETKEIQLTDLGKTLYDEVMDEIDEEINDGLGGLIAEEKINALSGTIKKSVEEKVVKLISERVKDDMTEVEKMILGEKLARVVTKNAKKELAELLSEIIEKTGGGLPAAAGISTTAITEINAVRKNSFFIMLSG